MTIKCVDLDCPRYLNCTGKSDIPAKYAGKKCGIQTITKNNDHITVDHGKDVKR